jgi:isopentenyldiphosphate isomerase
MESELLKIFNESGNEIGTASRAEVHKMGHWHETFHCWFTERIDGEDFIFLQIRSADKKDYPNLLDITAAGHILANEHSLDGLREIKEELGVELAMEELFSVGIIKDSLKSPNFHDNELCHVYLYNKHVPNEMYKLQKEEVSGIVSVRMDEFEKLWFEIVNEIKAAGFKVMENGQKEFISLEVKKENFVPHEDSYIKNVMKAMREMERRTQDAKNVSL